MRIIYIDLDGVVADFDKGKKEHPLGNVTPYKGRPDKLPGIYENLDPIENSIESVNKLLNHSGFDVYFLSTAPWDNPDAWTHKRLWVAKHFDEKLIRKRLILCHHKHLMIGDSYYFYSPICNKDPLISQLTLSNIRKIPEF